jgi:hypothetical protein
MQCRRLSFVGWFGSRVRMRALSALHPARMTAAVCSISGLGT